MEEEAVDTSDLRLELKKWEKAFAAANDGRKPGREDIKRDATISTKYKEYQNLQRQSREPHSTPKKATRAQIGGTPLAQRSVNNPTATPSSKAKGSRLPGLDENDALPEPDPTPAFIRTALGPTPQKDGEVLGIFDMLLSATPSKQSATAAAVPQQPTMCATPSKSSTLAPSSSMPELSRTPQSTSKRFFLDAFAGTPLKRKRDDDEEEGRETNTPSTSKRQFATPAFLRRYVPTMPTNFEDEDEEHDASRMAPPLFKKKRGLVRSLSTIIQGLRKQEEDRMDDEWAIMQEVEAEERGDAAAPAPAKPSAPASAPAPPRLLVEDSQVADLPLGPDRAADSSGDEDETLDPSGLDANGNPRKVWKKKGLKRQTKRVKMKPVLHRPKKAADLEQAESASETEEAQVAETQVEGREGSQSASEDENAPKKKSKKGKKAGKAEDGKGVIKKVSAQAHANFRRLKIKNKNSKANGRGRFGRR